MVRAAAVLGACVASLAAGSAPGAALAPRLPGTLVATLPGFTDAVAAAGARVVLVSDSQLDTCAVRVVDVLGRGRPGSFRCPSLVYADGVPFGSLAVTTSTVAGIVADSVSPHDVAFTLWTGPLPGGPLRQSGASWGWSDSFSDTPSGQGSNGCAQVAVAGGGVIAIASGLPNRAGADLDPAPSCPKTPAAAATTAIRLLGAPVPGLTVAGSWSLLATDGRRLLLTRLGDDGAPTGELAVRGLDGSAGAPLTVPPAAAARARGGWLTPEGVFLVAAGGRSIGGWPAGGTPWTLAGLTPSSSETVGYGRLVYTAGASLRVRRLRDGADRLLASLPRGADAVAAGSYGVVLALPGGGKGPDRTLLYRIPWRTVDAVLPASPR